MKCIFRKLSTLCLDPPAEKKLSQVVPYATVWGVSVCEGKSVEYPVIEIGMKPCMAALSIHVHWELMIDGNVNLRKGSEVRALLVETGKQMDLYRAAIRLPLEFESSRQHLRFGLEVRGYLDDHSGFSIHPPQRYWDLWIEQTTWLEEFYGGLTCEPILLLHPAERRVLNDWEGSTLIGSNSNKRRRRRVKGPSPLAQ